jgi:hypothetical protein
MVKTFHTASKLSAEELATNISNIWVFMAHIINIAFYPYTLWILYEDFGETQKMIRNREIHFSKTTWKISNSPEILILDN